MGWVDVFLDGRVDKSWDWNGLIRRESRDREELEEGGGEAV